MIRDVASKVCIAAGDVPPFDLGNQGRAADFPSTVASVARSPRCMPPMTTIRLTRACGSAKISFWMTAEDSEPSMPKRFLEGHFVLMKRSNSSASKMDSECERV